MLRKIKSRFFKNFIYLWIFLLDRKREVSPEELNQKRVLIADCEKIGNYIFKTPLIRGLKRNGFHVTVMGSHITRELLEEDEYIDEAIITRCYRKKSSNIFIKTAVAFRYRRRFSHYIENTGAPYLRELLFMNILSPAAILGRERKEGFKFNMMDVVISDQGHHIDNSLEVLRRMGIKEKREYHLGRGPSKKYANLPEDKPLVLYNGRASISSRSVPHEVEEELLSSLKDISYINFKQIEREESLHDLTALLERAALVITVDTGIAHIASALKKPVLSNNFYKAVAPVTPLLIKEEFTPSKVSKVLESLFLTSTNQAV